MKKSDNTFPKNYMHLTLLLLFAALATLFFTRPVQAALNRQKVDGGMRIYGTETVDYFDDEIEKVIGLTGEGDYTVNLSVTFPSVKDRPDSITYTIDNYSYTVYTENSNTLTDSRTIRELELESDTTLNIQMNYDIDYEDSCEVAVDFLIKELPKPTPAPPKLTLSSGSLPSLYPGDRDIFTLSIKDPSLGDYDNVDMDKVSVKIADSSIAKITKKDFWWNDKIDIYFKVMKAGSTKLSVTYKGVTVRKTITVRKTTFYVQSSASITLKQKKHINAYISQIGAGSCSVKKLKSSNPKVLSVSGKYLVAKKKGTAKVTFTLNGSRKTINFKVVTPAPKFSQLKTKLSGYTYYPSSGQTYFYVTFKNTSQRMITKVKMRYRMTLNEEIERVKTTTINLKPGASKKVKVGIGKCFVEPTDRKAKCLKFWYK